MGQIGLFLFIFVLFSVQNRPNFDNKKQDCVHVTRTQGGGRMVGADESTELWRQHPFYKLLTVVTFVQENHNIFAKLNPDEYRQVLGNIKHCILATDLALFFPNKARLSNILKEGGFSWDLPDHRYKSNQKLIRPYWAVAKLHSYV